MIFDSNKRTNLLVQKRSQTKELSPGLLSQSAGGHVGASSNPLETALRESLEELDIAPSLKRLTTFWHKSDNGKNIEQVSLYSAVHSGPFRIDPNEVEWAAFFSVRGIQALASKKPEIFCPGFLKDLEKLG